MTSLFSFETETTELHCQPVGRNGRIWSDGPISSTTILERQPGDDPAGLLNTFGFFGGDFISTVVMYVCIRYLVEGHILGRLIQQSIQLRFGVCPSPDDSSQDWPSHGLFVPNEIGQPD